MAFLVRLLLMLVICASSLRPALGAERAGDAVLMYALQDHTEVASALETDILTLIESAPDEDRFDLYRTYDQFMGAWIQVDLLQTLLERSVLATSPSAEEEIRTDLRDHARFALWELDEARMNLERNVPVGDRQEHFRINEAIRSLLSEARNIIGRLLAEQCLHVRCDTGP
jgi:hypothetical protein